MLLFLHVLLELFIFLETSEVKFLMRCTRGQNVPNAWMVLVYVNQPRLKAIPKVFFHLVRISKGPENVTLDPGRRWILIVLSLTVIIN